MKLLSILTTFTKIELNRLKKYVLSPYFNKNKDIINLFYELERLVTSKREHTYDKDKTWKKLFSTDTYNDVKFRKLNSDLLKLTEGFLAQELYQENPIHQATYLLESITKNELKKLNNSTLNSIEKLSEKQTHKPASHYFYQYQIERNKFELTDFDNKRTDVTNVGEIINNLDYFYLAEKLRYYGEALSRKNIITHDYELLFIDEIVDHIKNNKEKYELIPPIVIYFQMCLVQLEAENENHFYKLKELLNEHALIFPQDEATSIYTTAINYCLKKINTGNQHFLYEFLDLNEELLQKGIIGEDKLSPWKFKNIVTAGLKANRIEWTEDFIQKYYNKIPEAFRDNAFTFNMAQLYYYQKKYDKVMQLLQTVEYEDFTYSLTSKSILITTYYELDEIEALYSLLDSFRVFLNRQKELTTDRKRRFLDLIRYTKKLTKILPGEKKDLEKLKNDVQVTKSLAGKSWLLEKIAELEK